MTEGSDRVIAAHMIVTIEKNAVLDCGDRRDMTA